MNMKTMAAAATMVVAVAHAGNGYAASTDEDARRIAAIDTEYQLAVERNDWKKMDSILHQDFALVLGDGRTFNRQQLLDSSRSADSEYEKQIEMPGTQKVRMYGNDTATVTALLWLKGRRRDTNGGKVAFEYKLWFTDTYVRTQEGWKYAFGQASLRLPTP